MKRLALLLLTALVCVSTARAESVALKPERPQIEVVFVLDTTGSMSGLIEGAKQKIWAIANEMIKAKPTPQIRMGLVGYRDKGDEYVTTLTDLTDDIDAVYAKLREFKADGGGDTPESVNQALHEAVNKVSWSADRDVLKVIFLVGDAPPHMDYQDDVKYLQTCEAAVKKDLIINTVLCGGATDTRQIWEEIAHRSEGAFAAIDQSGGMRVVETPVDKELAEANKKLNETVVYYGSVERQEATRGKVDNASSSSLFAAGERSDYLSKSAATQPAAAPAAVTGAGDLVRDVTDGTVEFEAIKTEELPTEIQKLDEAGRKEWLAKRVAERKALQATIDELNLRRRRHLEEAAAKTGADRDSFDAQVNQMVREQANRKGIKYEDAPATQPAN